jgi:hypothetical protein
LVLASWANSGAVVKIKKNTAAAKTIHRTVQRFSLVFIGKRLL